MSVKKNIQAKMSDQAGLSLLELLLAVAALGVMSLMMIEMMRSVAEEERARGIAGYYKALEQAYSSFSTDIDHFDALYNETFSNAGVLEIPISGDPLLLGVPLTLEMGGTNLPGSNGPIDIPGSPDITPAFASRNPLKTDMGVIVRIADDMANPDDERMLEIISSSLVRVPDRITRKAASVIGGSGGFISAIEEIPGVCAPADCINIIRGAYGDWQIPVSNFNGTAWFTMVTANRASTIDGAYLVSYLHLSESQVAGDYLYRNPYPTMPDLNTMHQTFNIADNNVIGADNILTSSMYIGGHTYIQGSSYIESMYLPGVQMVVEQDMSVNRLELWQHHNPHPSLDSGASQYIIVEGEFTSASTSISSTSANTLSGNIINAGNVVTNSASVDKLNSTGTTAVNDLNSGSLNATDLQAPDITATSATTASLNTTNISTTDLNNASSFSATNNVGVTGNMNISRLTSCLSGCAY